MKNNLLKSGISFLLIIFMLGLTACGSNTSQSSNENTGSNTQTESKASTEQAATPENTDIVWPEKTIQITVPYNAGGDTDLYCRTAAKYLEKELGQTIIIVNTSGASGMTAAHQVMDSKADGYNIFFRHTAQLITQATGMADLSYTDDMALAGSAIEDSTYTLVVRKDSGFNNLEDLIAYAKANPGKLTYSNVYGSVTHYVSNRMKETMGIDFKDLDVGSSSSDRTAAFLGGQVDMLVANYITIKDYIDSDQFVVLGILSEERVPALPEVPTMVEQGYDVVSQKIYTFAFPKDTDQAIVDKFNNALESISQNQEFIDEVEAFYGMVKFRSNVDIYTLETSLVEDYAKVMGQ